VPTHLVNETAALMREAENVTLYQFKYSDTSANEDNSFRNHIR